ncbi:choice-of-anchor Q domain-containing protein [uncultured Nostoc sp.]|uniref:choice-of-anchor Q domain-containing protein n=1 Tax=uncultured Nostoc sp. TaxID=340711 RepID=UPI002619D086|nr:choice-of-anchor Q domain-containing protein [uncultured Nostoc sp.]
MSTFTVTNTNNSGAGSLQQAILNANALTGKDIIKFGGLFTDAIADTITLAGSSLSITDDLKIDGTGADLLTVSGNNAYRIFEISSHATVEIKGLTITKGNSYSDNSEILGGSGIYNKGTLTLSNASISSNNGDTGGGIYNTGSLTVSNSTISENISYFRGSGIYNTGTLKVSNSTISDNTASFYAGGIYNDGGILTVSNSTISGNNGGSSYDSPGFGGGIYNSGGTATVSNSTISNNGGGNGGGIYNSGTLLVNNTTINGNSIYAFVGDSDIGGGIYNSGIATVTNSTISGNKAHFGGGIYNNGGTLTVSNSTITLNTAFGLELVHYSGYEYGDGGGIYNSNSGTIIVKNSIVAGNFDTPNDDPANAINLDLVGKFISNGYNLIGSLGSSTGFNASEQLTVAITEVIDTTLQNNGGPVKTHALVTGSPAINGGKNADVPLDTTDQDGDGNITEQVPFDQRGSGFVRISGGKVDIGAFEAKVNVINGNCGSNTLNGTAGDDIITGYHGKDTITGGAGADSFVYTNIQDAGDTIADFKKSTDKIVLRQLFQNSGLANLNFASALANGYLRFETKGTSAIVLIDPDGSSGKGHAVNFITVSNVSTAALNNAINFAF